MSNINVSFTLHYMSFMIFLAVLTADLSYMDLPAHHTYAGRLKFLTFLSFIADLVYFNVAAIMDFLIWTRSKDSPLWRKVRDFVFTTMIFPYATFVCTMFWAIYLHNPLHLRTSEEIEVIPWWVDHGYHTLPIVTVLLQAYFIKHEYPRKRMVLVTLLVIDIMYTSWLFWIAHKANFWVYPFLAHMSFLGIFCFIATACVIGFGFYYLGKKFSDIVWENDKKDS